MRAGPRLPRPGGAAGNALWARAFPDAHSPVANRKCGGLPVVTIAGTAGSTPVLSAGRRKFPRGTAYPLSPPREGLRSARDFSDSPSSLRAGGQPPGQSAGGKRKRSTSRGRFVSGAAGLMGDL
ncbi:uncharacterized protein LOC106995109 [Macaca mulatta]